MEMEKDRPLRKFIDELIRLWSLALSSFYFSRPSARVAVQESEYATMRLCDYAHRPKIVRERKKDVSDT